MSKFKLIPLPQFDCNMIELFEKFKAARVKGACIIPEVFNNVLEIWVLSPIVQKTKRTSSIVMQEAK
jgi:hypothetical protein